MANSINQQVGMSLAYWGYTVPSNPDQQVLPLATEWQLANRDNDPVIQKLGTDWNVQRNSSGDIENQFQVLINGQEHQIVISFKGSTVTSNGVSDLENAGAAEFAKIQAKAQAAYDALKAADSPYKDYTIIAVGHSLGGGMAQTFAVKNLLDAYVYNSLPIANSTIDGDYFSANGGFQQALAAWRAVNPIRAQDKIQKGKLQ